MIALVGGAKAIELARCLPVKLARVNDASANCRAVTVHILCGGMGNDVSAPLDGTAVDGGGKGVINNEGNTVCVGNLHELLNIKNVQRRVSDGLTEDRLGVRSNRSLDLLLGSGGVHKGEFNAHSLHSNREEVICAAVNCGRGNNVVAC